MKYNNIEKYSTIWELFQKSIEKYNDQICMNYYRGPAHKKRSFNEVYLSIKKLAKFLEEQNLHKGDKIIIFSETRAEWLELFFAASLLGVIIIPIDLESPNEMILQILEETEPKLLFQTGIRRFPVKYNFESIILLDDLPRHIQSIEPITPREFAKNIDPDDIFEIIYTSGTTGKPKGVIITNKNFTTNIYNTLLVFPIPKKITGLLILPMSHAYAQILVIGVFALGAELYFVKKINPTEIKNCLKNNEIHILPGVPQVLISVKNGVENKFKKLHLLFFLRSLQNISKFIPSIRLKRLLFFFIHKELGGNLDIVIAGGAFLPPDVFQWWENMGVKVIKGYGLTETGPIMTLEDKDHRDPFSVGSPLPYQSIKIEDGELLAKGEHVSIGYFKNPEKNKEAFTEDGWFKTGDLGYIKNGKVYLHGRRKDMIVLSNGVNVYPQDIEFEFNKHYEIEDTCVIGIDTGKGEELFSVFLTRLKEDELEKIIQTINKKMSINQWVKNFYIWPEEDFPRTHTKKVKRNVVIQKVKDYLTKKNNIDVKNEINIPIEKDGSDIEITLKDTLSQILEIEPGEITNEKYLVSDLSLDSLGRAELITQIDDKLDKEIHESDITPNTKFYNLIEMVKNANASNDKYNYNGVTWPQSLLVRIYRNYILYPFIKFVLLFFFDTKINGKYPKLNRPILIVSNHRSNLDGVFINLLLPRRIRNNTFIAASGFHWDKTYRKWIRGLIQIFVPIYTIEGESAVETINKTAFYLNNGFNVIIYPEGAIAYEDKNKNKFQNGVARLVREFDISVFEIKVKGLDVIKRGRLLPKIGKNKIQVDLLLKEFNPFDPVEKITKELENDFEGY